MIDTKLPHYVSLEWLDNNVEQTNFFAGDVISSATLFGLGHVDRIDYSYFLKTSHTVDNLKVGSINYGVDMSLVGDRVYHVPPNRINFTNQVASVDGDIPIESYIDLTTLKSPLSIGSIVIKLEQSETQLGDVYSVITLFNEASKSVTDYDYQFHVNFYNKDETLISTGSTDFAKVIRMDDFAKTAYGVEWEISEVPPGTRYMAFMPKKLRRLFIEDYTTYNYVDDYSDYRLMLPDSNNFKLIITDSQIEVDNIISLDITGTKLENMTTYFYPYKKLMTISFRSKLDVVDGFVHNNNRENKLLNKFAVLRINQDEVVEFNGIWRSIDAVYSLSGDTYTVTFEDMTSWLNKNYFSTPKIEFNPEPESTDHNKQYPLASQYNSLTKLVSENRYIDVANFVINNEKDYSLSSDGDYLDYPTFPISLDFNDYLMLSKVPEFTPNKVFPTLHRINASLKPFAWYGKPLSPITNVPKTNVDLLLNVNNLTGYSSGTTIPHNPYMFFGWDGILDTNPRIDYMVYDRMIIDAMYLYSTALSPIGSVVWIDDRDNFTLKSITFKELYDNDKTFNYNISELDTGNKYLEQFEIVSVDELGASVVEKTTQNSYMSFNSITSDSLGADILDGTVVKRWYDSNKIVKMNILPDILTSNNTNTSKQAFSLKCPDLQQLNLFVLMNSNVGYYDAYTQFIPAINYRHELQVRFNFNNRFVNNITEQVPMYLNLVVPDVEHQKYEEVINNYITNGMDDDTTANFAGSVISPYETNDYLFSDYTHTAQIKINYDPDLVIGEVIYIKYGTSRIKYMISDIVVNYDGVINQTLTLYHLGTEIDYYYVASEFTLYGEAIYNESLYG